MSARDDDNDGVVAVHGTFTVNSGMLRETVHFSIDAERGVSTWGTDPDASSTVAASLVALFAAIPWADPALDN